MTIEPRDSIHPLTLNFQSQQMGELSIHSGDDVNLCAVPQNFFNSHIVGPGNSPDTAKGAERNTQDWQLTLHGKIWANGKRERRGDGTVSNAEVGARLVAQFIQ
jgi:hypothetical protein